MTSILKLLSVTVLIAFMACKKKGTTKEGSGSMTLKFENRVGDEPLVLSDDLLQKTYQNANGDDFTVTRYAYYVTNLELIKADGSVHTQDGFKFLVVQGDEHTYTYELNDIPAGNYTKVKCLLGVDSLHNVSGAQDGALDPLHGMFWDWNTGYIMAKLEGFSPQSGGVNNMLSFHLGGFSGTFSSLKEVTFDLPQSINITATGSPELTLSSDVAKWFSGFPVLKFQDIYSIMEIGRDAYNMSERYKDHLSVKEVKN